MGGFGAAVGASDQIVIGALQQNKRPSIRADAIDCAAMSVFVALRRRTDILVYPGAVLVLDEDSVHGEKMFEFILVLAHRALGEEGCIGHQLLKKNHEKYY